MRVRIPLTFVLCLGLIVPPSLVSAGATSRLASSRSVRVADVALSADAILHGLVVDSEGMPVSEAVITLRQQGRVLRQTISNAEGKYAFKHLQMGLYEIAAGEQWQIVRVWSADAAPPGAATSVPVLTPGPVVRGQWGGPGPGAVADILILGVGTAGLVVGLSALDKANDLEDDLKAPASP